MDRVRRRRLPAEGPPRQRLSARTHSRRAVHADGEGGVQLVQGLSAAGVPNPDEVPRRGPTAGGHPARTRVRHEGLLLLRRRRRRAARPSITAIATPTSGSSTSWRSATSSSRPCPGRWAAARPRSSLPRARSARTPSCGVWSPVTPPTSRRSNTEVPEAPPIEGLPEAKVHDTPDTPTIATLVEWANAVGLGREITAADTLKNVLLKVRQPGGEWELLAVGVPGDREVDEKRLGAALDPAEYALLDDADFAKNPFLVKGYVGPKGVEGQRCSISRRSTRGRRDVLDHRCGRAEQTRRRSGRRAGLRRRRHHRSGRGPRWRPVAGRGGPAGVGPRHRDRPHIPAGAQVHRRVHRRRPRRGRKAGAADDGVLRHRGVSAGRGDRRTASRRARPALAVVGLAVRCPRRDRQQGRRRPRRRGRAGRRPGRGWVSRCCSTTGSPRPG